MCFSALDVFLTRMRYINPHLTFDIDIGVTINYYGKLVATPKGHKSENYTIAIVHL